MIRQRLRTCLLALLTALTAGALTASVALAAGAPSAFTEGVGHVTQQSASLTGLVASNGAETEYFFEYGTTTSYGNTTAIGKLPAESKGVEVKQTVFGLTWGTSYHFRVVAKNAFGTSDGADRVFKSEGVRPTFVLGEKSEFPKSFTWSGGISTWYGAREPDWKCSGFTGSGTIVSGKTLGATVLNFTGCKYERNGGRFACTTSGAKSEEIRTTESSGTLVYRSKAETTVGIVVEPKGTFLCGGVNGTLRGTVLLPVTPVNTHAESFLVTSTRGNKEYENQAGEKLTTTFELNWPSVYEPFSWEFESSLRPGGEGTITELAA